MADLARGFYVVSNSMRDLSSRSRSTAALRICSDFSQMSGSFFVNRSRPGCGSAAPATCRRLPIQLQYNPHVQDGSWRNRWAASRDRRAEPWTPNVLVRYVKGPRGEPAGRRLRRSSGPAIAAEALMNNAG